MKLEKLPKNFYYKRNRLQQLRGFCATVQYGSPSKAAQALHLGQSAITMQIQSLESELQTKLLNKNRGNFTPTADGKILYDMAVSVINSVDSIYEKFIIAKHKSNYKILDMAATHVAISYLIPGPLKIFKDKYPDVRVNIRNMGRDKAYGKLSENETEIFISSPTDVPADFENNNITDFKPVLLAPKDHPVLKQKSFSLAMLQKYELLRIDPHLNTIPNFEEIIQSHKAKTTINFENGDWDILKKFVQEGIGISIVSNIAIKERDIEGGIDYIDLSKFFPKFHYKIIYPKEKILSYYAKEFRKILLDYYKAEDGSETTYLQSA